MAIEARWDNAERTTILVTIEGRMRWQDFESAWADVDRLMKDIDHAVDVIYDVRHVEMFPADFVPYLRHRFPKRPPKMRRNVAVGADTYIQLLWKTASIFAPHFAVTFFPTLDEARAYLKT